jgi:hypothetical protein
MSRMFRLASVKRRFIVRSIPVTWSAPLNDEYTEGAVMTYFNVSFPYLLRIITEA